MDNRKQRIEAFIASHGDAKLESGAFILGGKKQTSDPIPATTNGLNCTNDQKDSCNESINGGNCKNAAGTCDNSTNRGSCMNTTFHQS